MTEGDRYRKLLEELPLITYIDEPHETAPSIYISPQVETLLGYSREEWQGNPKMFPALLHPEDRDRVMADHAEVFTRGEPRWSFEYRLIARDGRVVWFRDEGMVITNDRGTPLYVQGFMVDITEQKQAEQALRESIAERAHLAEQTQRHSQYLESLLRISPVAIVTVDLEANVTSWNPSAERLFGYSPEEALGRNIDDLVARSEDLHAEAVAYSDQVVQQSSIHTVTRRTRKDGTLVDVELLGVPVVMDGEPIGHLGIYHDITELQQQKRYYESLVELSPSAVVTMDPDDKVTSWNPAAVRLFGYSADEAIGQNIDDLVANRKDLRAQAEELNRKAQKGQFQFITRRTRKDGSLVDVVVLGSPIIVMGEPVGLLALYHDISEVQRQKHYYQSLLEVSPSAIVTIDREDNVTSWNPAAEELFGYTREEAVGRNVDDLVARSADLHAEAVTVNREAERGRQVRLTTRRTRKDGSLVDVALLAAPIKLAGELIGTYVIYHDISEVQRQKHYYQSLLKISPVAVVTIDRRSTVTSWNPAAERLFGYGAEEAIGCHIDDLVVHGDDMRVEAAAIDRKAFDEGGAQAITRRSRKDGSLVDVELLVVPLILEGEPVGAYSIYHDITELQRQKRYYESLLELSPSAVVTMGLDGNVTSWNPGAERLFGYSAAEAFGRNIDDLVAKSERVYAEAANVSRKAQRGQVQLITRRTRKDGSLVDVVVLASPIILSGEPVGVLAIYHDITELQSARQQAEAATQAKSAFLAAMSHEIRTPMNAVIGMTGLLLDTGLNPEQRHYAEVIRDSGETLLGVINDILDFSKIEAGKLDLEEAPFDLRDCVESAMELVAAAAAKKGLDLAYDLDPAAPGAIVGDVTRLRQVLINLLNNAVKFTERGEVVLAVDAEPLASGDGSEREERQGPYRLHFAVRDSGIGIPPDRMNRLFESFSQVDTSTTRRYGGTGLGLAISRRLAELMGGTMWAQSRVAEGSTFHFTIEAESAPGRARAFDVAAAPQLAGKRVLIVDDNATNRHIVARQVHSWGMLPRETASPAEALEWVRRGDPFDLAILDMQMPDMDGLTLGGEIRRYRSNSTLPLLMLTSLGQKEEAPGAAEFAAYLTKPIRASQLYEALVQVSGAAPGVVQTPSAPAGATARLAEEVPLRILVAEDNSMNQQLAVLLLAKMGYRPDVAANGVETLQALERQPYDVVLMDVEMPEMDGLEATRRIHERWQPERGPRIIAVTANAMQGERELCLEAGMDDYISKPIRTQELVRALRRSASLRVESPPGRETPGSAEPPLPRPATTAEATREILDQAVLPRLVGSFGTEGPDVVAGLIDTFLNDAPRQLAAVWQAMEDEEAGELTRAAHTLKSNSATLGAMALSDLARELEALAKSGTLEQGSELLPQMEAALERVTVALRRARQELR